MLAKGRRRPNPATESQSRPVVKSPLPLGRENRLDAGIDRVAVLGPPRGDTRLPPKTGTWTARVTTIPWRPRSRCMLSSERYTQWPCRMVSTLIALREAGVVEFQDEPTALGESSGMRRKRSTQIRLMGQRVDVHDQIGGLVLPALQESGLDEAVNHDPRDGCPVQ